MIIIYLFFAALIAYAIRLYIKKDEPFDPIKAKNLRNDSITDISSIESMPMDNRLHPVNWDDDDDD